MVETEECSLLPRHVSPQNSRMKIYRSAAGYCVPALVGLAAIASSAVGSSAVGSSIEAPYTVEHLDLPSISSPMWESHPAVDPLTGDLGSSQQYGLLRMADRGESLQRGRIKPPGETAIAAVGSRRIHSSHPMGEFSTTSHPGTPARVPVAISTSGGSAGILAGDGSRRSGCRSLSTLHCRRSPRLAADGWLYFRSRRPGGFRKDDI